MRILSLETRRAGSLSRTLAVAFIVYTMFCLSHEITVGISGDESAPARTLGFATHDPIYIEGNAGFTNESGVRWGSGTESDPYIIEDLAIDVTGGIGIYVMNTDRNFIIRECNFYVILSATRIIWGGPGVELQNCVNGRVSENICLTLVSGIALQSADNNTIDGNICSGAGFSAGISLFDSCNNRLAGNDCRWNHEGISLTNSSANAIQMNVLLENSGYGVTLDTASSFNLISRNTFKDNNGAGSTYDPSHVQAKDNGTGNLWNDIENVGNYWSDWTGPDVIEPLYYVDYPYNISGAAGSRDFYPLTDPPVAPIQQMWELMEQNIQLWTDLGQLHSVQSSMYERMQMMENETESLRRGLIEARNLVNQTTIELDKAKNELNDARTDVNSDRSAIQQERVILMIPVVLLLIIVGLMYDVMRSSRRKAPPRR